MATNNNLIQQSLLPVFKGENYDYWRIKMITLFRSQELWEIVENGYPESEEDEARQRENRKKDARALFFIQQSMHETIFSRIAGAYTAKEAWSILMEEFQGSAQVKAVRLQSLRREFETLFMKNEETVQDFLSRAKGVVNQMRSLGDTLTDATIVSKILRSLPQKFDHVVAAIEESKNLSTFGFDALMGSLLAHEERINRYVDKPDEKVFQAVAGSSFQVGRERERGRFGNRGRGRGRGRGWQGEGRRCYNCNKIGHLARDCRNLDT